VGKVSPPNGGVGRFPVSGVSGRIPGILVVVIFVPIFVDEDKDEDHDKDEDT